MSISSVAQHFAPQQVAQSQATQEQSRVPTRNDNDADDGSAPVKASNSPGVGGLIDVTA